MVASYLHLSCVLSSVSVLSFGDPKPKFRFRFFKKTKPCLLHKEIPLANGGEICNFVCVRKRKWGKMKQRTLCQRSSCVWRMIRNTPWTTNGARRATLVFHRKEPTWVERRPEVIATAGMKEIALESTPFRSRFIYCSYQINILITISISQGQERTGFLHTAMPTCFRQTKRQQRAICETTPRIS